MGAWSVSITGNDTAQDLKSEYQAAFFYNDVETALAKIDSYVREEFDETDEEEWCNYYYSLTDFMWKHGILIDSVKNRALEMIDSNFGLSLWEESGIKVLEKRKKVLSEFRARICNEQPQKKKIKIDCHMSTIFETGDLVAIQLKTMDKHYIEESSYSKETFKNCNEKYVVLRKVTDHISYTSSVEPNVKDIWAVFQLYKKIFDVCPTEEQLRNVPWADTDDSNGEFICESSMFYFKTRNYSVIGNNIIGIDPDAYSGNSHIFFSVNKPWYNADSLILDAILS